VIHPKYAAKRETGSASLTITPGPLSDVETDEESLPSSARDGSESESSAASDEDIPLAREPDPEATRRSSRTSAQKMVNYVSTRPRSRQRTTMSGDVVLMLSRVQSIIHKTQAYLATSTRPEHFESKTSVSVASQRAPLSSHDRP